LISFVQAVPWDRWPDGTVIELDDNSFDQRIANHEWAVFFYNPLCSHCLAVKPVWHQIGMDLRFHRPNLTIAQIDAVDFRVTADRFNITSYPNLFFFRNGELIIKYSQTGPRTVEVLVRWIEENSVHSPLVQWGYKPLMHSSDGQPDGHEGEVWTIELLKDGETFDEVQARVPVSPVSSQSAIELVDNSAFVVKDIGTTTIPSSVLILLVTLTAFVVFGVSMIYLPKQCPVRSSSPSPDYEPVPTTDSYSSF